MNPQILLQIIFIVYIFIFGLVIGSFLNVLIYRIPLGLNIAKGRSFCTSCKHSLNYKDLFPLFSYLFLGGKCRYCKTKISIVYPVVELINAILYLLVYLKFGLSYATPIYFIIVSCLLTLSMIDLEHKIIPDRFHVIIGICAIAIILLGNEVNYLEHIIGLFAISVPIYIIALVSGGMGEGDVKLFAVCGLLLGWKLIVMTMFFASILASIYSLVLMIFKKAEMKSEIPFGPFISASVIICALVGNNLLDWYSPLIAL